MPEPRPSRSSFQTYLFIALVAVELLMSFTFLGYLHVQPISITFAYIPPILAGCLLGPVQATVLGAVFWPGQLVQGVLLLCDAHGPAVLPLPQRGADGQPDPQRGHPHPGSPCSSAWPFSGAASAATPGCG